MLASAVLVFLSYAWSDQPAAREIEDRLTAAGCTVWRDETSLDPGEGDGWRANIERAIERADIVVALISEASKASENVGDELAYARALRRRIVPVPLSTEKMPLILARLQWVRPKDVGRLCTKRKT